MIGKSMCGKMSVKGIGSVYFKTGLVLIISLLFLSWALPALAQTWVPTGSMGTDRRHATVTRLNDGRVFVKGGVTTPGNNCLNSAEIWDPTTNQFTSTGFTTIARALHTATLLPDGTVLVAGGWDGSSALTSAEIWDPATGSVTFTGSLNTGRGQHTATLLNNGKVLLVGGWNPTLHQTAELYDPSTGFFSNTAGIMSTHRNNHTATLLPDGRVLVAGGWGDPNNTTVKTAELYDPSTESFCSTGSMTSARGCHSATLLPNGKVLLAGGYSGTYPPGVGTPLSSAELYDPAAGTFSAVGSMTVARQWHTMTLLNNGKVLIAGGNNDNSAGLGGFHWAFTNQAAFLSTAELFDPATNAFNSIPSMSTKRNAFATALLSNGEVLVPGGGYASAELYTGLVAYYPFSGDADDESGYNNHGTVQGGAALTEDRFGNAGSAYYFDGIDGLITTTEDDFAANNNLSVSLWIKPVEQKGFQLVHYFVRASGFGVAQKTEETDGTAGLAIHLPLTDSAMGPITYGDWTYLVGTYDGQEIRAYINGSLAMITPWPGNIYDSDRDLHFGGKPGCPLGDCFWEGTLDDVRIYNRVLSQAEIRQLMGPLPDPCFALGGDTDGDGICDDGDRSGTAGDNPCTGGNTANCDDNCPGPGEVNPDQADYNNNGVGDLCDDTAMGELPGDKPEGTAVPSYTPTGELFLDVTVTLKAIFPDMPTPYIRPNEYNVIPRLQLLGSDIPADTIHCEPFVSIPGDLVWVPVGESLDFPVQFPLSKWWTKLAAPGTTYQGEVWYVSFCKDMGPYQQVPEAADYPDIVQVEQLLDTVDIPIDQHVGDQCPGDGYDFGEGAGGTGCPYADYNLVKMHEVYLGKGPSSKDPLSGASVRVYDRNNSYFQCTFGNNPKGSDYPVIFELITEAGEGLVGACITDADGGECYVGEPQRGDYLVIVKYVDKQTGKTVYVGRPKDSGDFVNGIAEKEFQIIKVTKRDESVQFRGGKKTFVTGSILEVISPETAIWEGTQSVYPFIFTSDSDWSVDVCAEVPSGYSIVGVYDENGDLIPSTECVKTFVSGETKTVAFEVQEVGSPEPWLDSTLDIVSPKGKKLKKKFKTYDIRMKTFKAKVKELKAKKK